MTRKARVPLFLLWIVLNVLSNIVIAAKEIGPHDGTVIQQQGEKFELVVNSDTNSLDIYALDRTKKPASKELQLKLGPDELENIQSNQIVRSNLVDNKGTPHYQVPLTALENFHKNIPSIERADKTAEKKSEEDHSGYSSTYEERLMNRYPEFRE